ncbi:mucin-binding protein [Lactobacillus crispatus]
MADTNLRDNNNQQLAGSGNGTNIINDKVKIPTGAFQSKQMQTENCKVNNQMLDKTEVTNSTKNSSTLNVENSKTADLSRFDYSLYTKKVKSFEFRNSDNNDVIRTVILNKPTGVETVTMTLNVSCLKGRKHQHRSHTSTRSSIYNYKPQVIAEVNTSNNPLPKISILEKNVLPKTFFQVDKNTFLTQQDKENYEKFISVNKNDISIELPAFSINDIDIPGYSYHINAKKTTPGAGLGKEKFYIYTESPQTVVIDYTPITVKVEHKIITVTPTDPKTPSDKLPDNPGKNYPKGVDKKDLNKTVKRTITVNKPAGSTVDASQETTLTRTATVDEVTGQVTYGKWTTSKLDKYNAPEIPGYTPSQAEVPAVDQVTVDYTDPKIEITYTPTEQTGKITYVDPNGKEVGTTPLTGKTDEEIPVTPNVPAGWQIVPDPKIPTKITATPDGIQTVTVKVEHKIITVTPTDPKTPSDKLPDNPGKNYPKGVDKKDLNKTVKRTITVNKPAGSTVDASQETTLTRTATVDEVTGQVTYGKWTTSKLDKYNAPEIPGYTPSQAEVPAVDQVTVDYTDPKIEITYTPTEQTGKITYVDPNGKEVGTTPLTGKTDEEIPVTPNVPAGWQIVPDPKIPTKITATPDGIQTVTVKVEHKIITVTPTDPKTPSDKLPDNPGKNYPKGVDKKDLNKTVKRTITVNKPAGSTVDASQETTLTRTATVDEVTGQVTYGKWTTSKLDKYNAPEIPGYTPSQAEVPAVDQVTVDYTDPKIEITYTPTEQTGKITYVDPNGKEVGTTPLTGKTDEEIPVTPNVPAGWQIVPDPKIPTKITATPDGIQTVTVKVEHKIITVTPTDPKTPSDKLPDNPGKNYPKGVDKKDLNKTVKRTITVNKPAGSTVDASQETTLTRTATVDEVTGQVTYGKWTTSKLDKYNAPEIPGYTPSQAEVPAVDQVTVDYTDPKIEITYTPTEQTGKITYVDPNGKEVGTTPLTGKTDEEIPVTPNVPAGWQIVPDPKIPTKITATPDGIQTVTVKVEHKIITVTPTDPKTPSDKLPDNPGKNYPKGVDKKDLNKTVKRTITVNKPAGSTVDASQETTLTRTATVDEVTGQVTYGKWTTSKLDKYNAPEIPGYTPSQAEVPAVDQVTVDYTDPKIEITYTPTEQTGKITYVDPNGKEVGTTPLTGKTDEEIPVTPNVPAGWQIVPDPKIPTKITATPDGIQTVTVKVEHKIITVTPTDPKTPSDKLPDNPGKNYPKGVDKKDLNKTVKRTITSQPTTAKDNQLPQTGNDNSLTLMGLGASTLLGMFGLAAVNKKRK